MLTLLQILRKTWRALNSDASPAACGAGVFIGCLLGLAPFGPQTVLVLLLLLIFRIPVAVALASSAVLKIADVLVIHFLAAPLGAALLSEGSFSRSIVTTLLDLPVIGLVPLERHAVLGGLVVGALLGLALWYPVARAIVAYRRALQEKILENRWYRKLNRFSWLFGGALKGGRLS